MKQKAWGAILLSSALLLTGCTSDKEAKKETKEKVEQTDHKEDNPEDVKVYNSVHSQYEKKIDDELNQAMELWKEAKEGSASTLQSPKFKEDVQKVTENTLADIENVRKEIRVPKSKERENDLYVGFLNETEQAMKKLAQLAKEENSALIRDVEVHFSTAVNYYDRFKKEEQGAK
ncbi:hypothetical protein BACCIP111899_03087 [Bacillus rhizoplanae]|uniref:Lipoprotein n=1 Tax=Bacillus rhizoplanae TaxID=2880966 RepID=A0ABM8YDU7_9BACI|nr:hypothetical protein [Bacillus rhizoplanae]CAG9613867.1 hypothetical protein BACCIP111899_03087 [Bacillus rhizoplanae]